MAVDVTLRTLMRVMGLSGRIRGGVDLSGQVLPVVDVTRLIESESGKLLVSHPLDSETQAQRAFMVAQEFGPSGVGLLAVTALSNPVGSGVVVYLDHASCINLQVADVNVYLRYSRTAELPANVGNTPRNAIAKDQGGAGDILGKAVFRWAFQAGSLNGTFGFRRMTATNPLADFTFPRNSVRIDPGHAIGLEPRTTNVTVGFMYAWREYPQGSLAT
jgi:hypothetical protein